MTFTDKEKEKFFQIIEAVSNRYCAWLTEQIQCGKGNAAWDALKQGRSEFGEGVYAPFLQFKTVEEVDAFLINTELPAHEVVGAYIDTTCIDDFIKNTGSSLSSKRLTLEVGELMRSAKQPWQQPVLVFVVLGFLEQEDGSSVTVGSGCMVDWWDTEAETVPYPKITKAKVRKLLSQQQTPIVALSTRNPLQAGKNMNAWMDVCSEMNLTPWIDAESLDALQHLSAKNKAKTVSIPFS